MLPDEGEVAKPILQQEFQAGGANRLEKTGVAARPARPQAAVAARCPTCRLSRCTTGPAPTRGGRVGQRRASRLYAAFNAAVEAEDYEEARRLKEQIDTAMMPEMKDTL